MKLVINTLETIDNKIFDEFQEFARQTPFDVKVILGEKFEFKKEKKLFLDRLSDDVDIFQLDDYDCIEHFGRNFLNLSKITSKYQKENFPTVFYVNVPFYHSSILPIPFVYAGKKIELIDGKCAEIFEINATVDFKKNHLLICATNLPTNQNYCAIFHELFHLVHDKKYGTYANGKQIAHCTNFVNDKRCIMNPPNKLIYLTDKKNKEEKLGTSFCSECTNKILSIEISQGF